MTDNGLAAFYRRYNACCNEHRFEDLARFVARDVVINGTDRGLDAYRIDADHITEVWGTAFDVHLLQQLRRRTSEPPQ
jgi:predicted ester cyclase